MSLYKHSIWKYRIVSFWNAKFWIVCIRLCLDWTCVVYKSTQWSIFSPWAQILVSTWNMLILYQNLKILTNNFVNLFWIFQPSRPLIFFPAGKFRSASSNRHFRIKFRLWYTCFTCIIKLNLPFYALSIFNIQIYCVLYIKRNICKISIYKIFISE